MPVDSAVVLPVAALAAVVVVALAVLSLMMEGMSLFLDRHYPAIPLKPD